jgi:DNA-binding NarL/FixJ family response regulator
MNVNGEIVFSTTVAVTKMLADQHKSDDYIDYRKERAAMDLGAKIAEEKGWNVTILDDIITMDIRLYVFTPTELKDYMDAKFKAKLREMAANEKYLTDREREVLMIQSERF